jgi:hypothetical protein
VWDFTKTIYTWAEPRRGSEHVFFLQSVINNKNQLNGLIK